MGCCLESLYHARGSFNVCILCVSLSGMLLGVVAPHSEVLLVYTYCVSQSELLLGVVR